MTKGFFEKKDDDLEDLLGVWYSCWRDRSKANSEMVRDASCTKIERRWTC